MAIVIEQRKRGGGVMRLLIAVVILGIIGAAGYYLFFAPSPAFDFIVPTPLQRASALSKLDLDPSVIFESASFKALRKYGGAPSGDTFGRANPFLQ